MKLRRRNSTAVAAAAIVGFVAAVPMAVAFATTQPGTRSVMVVVSGAVLAVLTFQWLWQFVLTSVDVTGEVVIVSVPFRKRTWNLGSDIMSLIDSGDVFELILGNSSGAYRLCSGRFVRDEALLSIETFVRTSRTRNG